ncbi:MAG: zinc-dependent alcohol dehydrogenase family protein [Alphaproteobacteria bacterium]
MKIKAAVLRQAGASQPYAESRPLSVEEVDLDPPGPGEVLVQVKAASLCHSDLSVVNGDRPRPLPMVIGHEASGIVAECGPGVDDLAPGDHVVMIFVPSCGRCGPCTEGRPALCEPAAVANGNGTLLSGDRRLSKDGQPIYHHVGVSAFAEYAVVWRRSLIKVPADLKHDEAALFGCGVLTGVGAVVNTAAIRAGQSVGIVGLGGVGLNAMLGAIAAGARQVVAIDMLDEKLDLARQLGATDAVSAASPDAVEQVKALTQGGVEIAVETAGSVKAMELAYRVTRRGGTTVTAGLPHPDHRWPLQHVHLVGEERTVMGSYIGSCVPTRDLPRYIELYRRGRLPVDRLLSDHLRLEDINAAFDRLATGKTVRQIVMFDH